MRIMAEPILDGLPSDAEAAFDGEGVDRTLIREMLTLSPSERLRRLEELVEFIVRVREANGITAVS
jgi:hypothetical protein